MIHLHRVVDHEIARRQRIDPFRIAAEPLHRLAHDREIHHGRHAREILRQNPRRHEGDFLFLLCFGIPIRQRFDVARAHVMVVFLSEQVFQQDFQRNRQPRDVLEAGLFQEIEPENIVALVADGERLSRAETVHILLCH